MQLFNINQSILASHLASKEQSALNQTADAVHAATAQKMNAHAAAEIRQVQETKNSNSLKLETDQHKSKQQHQQQRKSRQNTAGRPDSAPEFNKDEDNPNLGTHIDITL